MDRRAYKEHKRNKLECQRTRKYFEHLGVPVVSGSEDRITSSAEWLKPNLPWVDCDLEDDASTHPHDPWTRGGDEPKASNRNNEIEEEESNEDDDESDDEPVDASSSEEWLQLGTLASPLPFWCHDAKGGGRFF